MVPNGPFLEKWTMLILGSAVHHKFTPSLWMLRSLLSTLPLPSASRLTPAQTN